MPTPPRTYVGSPGEPKSGVCLYKALSHRILITYHPKQTRYFVPTSVLITVLLAISFIWAYSSPAQTVLLSSG